jgi:riboflavin kinase/FMN adenylyltransferase
MQIQGIVVHGKKQARELGYPTANIEYSSSDHLESGVWTCWMLLDGEPQEGLAVVGMWKLSGGEPSVEVHLLDISPNLYNAHVQVEIGHRLRPLLRLDFADSLFKAAHSYQAISHSLTSLLQEHSLY